MASEIPSVGSLSEYLDAVAKYSRERLTLTVFQELQHMSGGTFPEADMARKMATKWFRGQSEDLPLVPKPYRPGRRYDERAMVLDCRRKAAILGVVPEWSDYPSWLFLMQHHGLPTRLLDWTESSAVGLYFAVESWRSYRKDASASAFSPVV